MNLQAKIGTAGKINCHLKVTASFVTYVIVNGVVVGRVTWSVNSDTGKSQEPKVIEGGQISPIHEEIIKNDFPGFSLPKYNK